jgi:hypothetical protein
MFWSMAVLGMTDMALGQTGLERVQERMVKGIGAQSMLDGICCWKVYAQGFGSGWAGIMRYGAMYWTPLIVCFILDGCSSGAGTSPEVVKISGGFLPSEMMTILSFAQEGAPHHNG